MKSKMNWMDCISKRAGAMKALLVGSLLFGVAQANIIELPKVPGQHNSTAWQSLGEEVIADSTFIGRNLNNQASTTNNGVSWTWNDANGDGDISVNEQIDFTFDLYKALEGSHTYDALMVWINGEEVYRDSVFVAYNGEIEPDGNYFVKTTDQFFYSTSFAEVGDYTLTARVTCSSDLNDELGGGLDAWTSNMGTYLPQGEREDYLISVGAVPEPASMALMGLGLVSLVFFRRKLKK